MSRDVLARELDAIGIPDPHEPRCQCGDVCVDGEDVCRDCYNERYGED